ncbi:hypothetical protein KI387_020374, partial [Taxus chinensis]
MEFMREMEIQRMQLFMQMQVELAKMKHGKHGNNTAAIFHSKSVKKVEADWFSCMGRSSLRWRIFSEHLLRCWGKGALGVPIDLLLRVRKKVKEAI